LLRVRGYQFPVVLNAATRLYFERSAALADGQFAQDMRAVARGQDDTAAIERLSARPNIVGLLRTTCVATMLQAGHARNALAQSATAAVNCRILPDDDPVDILRKLQELAGSKVTVRPTRASVRAPLSPLLPEVMQAVETVSAQMWPGVPVVPTMGVSTTDSRLLRKAGIPMYGVSGLFVDPADTGVHGLNEHIGVQQLYDGREFLYRLIKKLAGPAR
jgi:acetylornithine deacetylase/succinyl-diaminopimelate desuccinylase-like protein